MYFVLRTSYFVLRKDAFPDVVRNTKYEAFFQGQEAFEL